MFVTDDKLGLIISYDTKGMLIGHHIISGRQIFKYEVTDKHREGVVETQKSVHEIDQSNNLNNVYRKKSTEHVTQVHEKRLILKLGDSLVHLSLHQNGYLILQT